MLAAAVRYEYILAARALLASSTASAAALLYLLVSYRPLAKCAVLTVIYALVLANTNGGRVVVALHAIKAT